MVLGRTGCIVYGRRNDGIVVITGELGLLFQEVHLLLHILEALFDPTS